MREYVKISHGWLRIQLLTQEGRTPDDLVPLSISGSFIHTDEEALQIKED
jgi:hypothetical protein